jgi:RNA polymerase sigma factor (sigma-70 family)
MTSGARITNSGELASMGHLAKGSVAQQIGTLFEGGSVAGLSDRQLLERFNARRGAAGEAAFAALVARHGPMVLGVCRQILADGHLAEDAFQATFLVLARKARSIRDSDRLGNWLYGVALRTARGARLRLARRREREEVDTIIRSGSNAQVAPALAPAEEAIMAREQAEALHGEIARLPDAFRLPIVLCYLEGLTVHEAARQLRWSHGTVRSRMARAREKLRRGLTRRGIVLPAAALAAVLDSRPGPHSASRPDRPLARVFRLRQPPWPRRYCDPCSSTNCNSSGSPSSSSAPPLRAQGF